MPGFGGSADPLNQLAIPTVDCGLPRNLEELHRSWITLGMRAMADASDPLPLLRMLVDDSSSGFIQVGIDLPGGKRVDKPLGRIFRRSQMDTAGSQQRCRDGALQRFGRSSVGQPGGNNAADHAVLDQHHQQRINHARLCRRRLATGKHQPRHLGERNFTQQLLDEVVTANENPALFGFAEAGDDFAFISHIYLLSCCFELNS